MNKGIILINKPSGWTSFDVVNKIKHILKTTKVGHLGTLDPMATGVLMVTIGKATKLFDLMQEKTKTYIAKFKFGELTDTLDSTGTIIDTTDIIPSRNDIISKLNEFVGAIEQIPPKFSAKSINGKRAYDLARENVDFSLKPCRVMIHSLNFIDFTNDILTLKIVCGSGTYIRAIGRDIASILNSYATMTSLVRTDIGRFNINNCKDITSLNMENILESIHRIDDILDYPILKISDIEIKKLLNGQSININETDGKYKINDEVDTIAIINVVENKAKMSIFLG